MHGAAGYTTLWIHLVTLNYTLKNDYDDKFYVMHILLQ